MRKIFLRTFVIALVTFTLLFGLEFFGEWYRAGFPGVAERSFASVRDNTKLVDVLSPMARAYNNVLAMLLGMIALAIPLTANMHTPKLIEMFLADKINRIVLMFMVFGAANVLWVDYMVGPEFAPTWAVSGAVVCSLIGWALLLPYYFYILRFIDPSRMILRIRDETMRTVIRVARRKADSQDAQVLLLRRLGQLGTMVIKALDRQDRDVAAEGAWALKKLLDHYDRYKSRMPREWFVVDRADFLGLSDEALEMLTESKTWFELKCLLQLELGFNRALVGAHDTVSVFSDALRVIASRADENREEQALRLCIRFFNNFLREAIKRGNLRAVYDVFHQYRKLARTLVDRPEILREVGRHFVYYAGMARINQMIFAPHLALFDLGYIVRRAYERASPVAPELLADALSLPHRTRDDVHTMAVKAKLMLGGFFVEIGHDEEAALVRTNLDDVPGTDLDRCRDELLSADRAFFEVTDRQLNLEYVPPERREPLEQFCNTLSR